MPVGTCERYTDNFDYEPPEPHYITLALDVCALLVEYNEAVLDNKTVKEITLKLGEAIMLAQEVIEQSGHERSKE